MVQIGAFTGDTANDPLCAWLKAELPAHPQASVVLVEPVGEYFAKLQTAYAGMPIHLENVAIAEAEGDRDFYRLGVDPARYGQPPNLAQLGSLRADRMTALWDSYEGHHEQREFWLDHRVVEKVKCTTLHRLLDRYGLTKLDLLQIDTEGYDYEILRTIDFEHIQPRFVNYERVLLQNDEAECRAMMRAAGYVLADWGQDTLCIRPLSD